MKPRILHCLTVPLRLAGTGLSFGIFGAGGIFFALFVTPWLALFRRGKAERARTARTVVNRWFRIFVAMIRAAGLVQIEVKGAERLRRPGLVVLANHPSLIDVVCLMSVIENATTIVKASLTTNPFTRAPVRAAGFVPNDAGADALERLLADLDSGATFVIFPEGTRTPVDLPAGEVPRMHRGAAALALAASRPVTPVRITARPRWLTKDVPWWRLPERRMTLTFEVLEDIPVEPLLPLYNARPALAARRLTKTVASRLFPGNAADDSNNTQSPHDESAAH